MRTGRFLIAGWDEKCQALAEPQLKVAVQMLNQSYAVSLREKNDEGFVLSLQKLMADGRISLEPFVERQISFIVSKLDEIQDSEKLEAESTQTLLQEADSYSVLAGESLLNKMENFVDGVFYVEYLVNNEETLSNLKNRHMISEITVGRRCYAMELSNLR